MLMTSELTLLYIPFYFNSAQFFVILLLLVKRNMQVMIVDCV